MVEDGPEGRRLRSRSAVHEAFTKYRKTHNDGVFDAYTPEIMRCRKSGIITGLPDAYGRGRIIGDYRRVALYGVDRLLEAKQAERAQLDDMWPTDEVIRMREETGRPDARARRPRDDGASSTAATSARPAANAREAVQWTYFGYLGAIKEANGAAMSIGRISTFLDIYIERDLQRRHARRGRRAGAHGPARAEAAHRPLPAHARLRRAVHRRSLLGDRMHRRHGPRRPPAGHHAAASACCTR